ncbi:hypothetical protein BDV95DRAFT_599832 [Massariosphaeria phaeospora]|uniref:Uncharacterized protein n=1 Tax=Massariosphaeria phaeospora TaxID=100035 RepID=A0A7C8HYS7_9PLEO|nr:hypothetical protein BDV95DRAFT_599832 [Massariosphaeria phaeospora]
MSLTTTIVSLSTSPPQQESYPLIGIVHLNSVASDEPSNHEPIREHAEDAALIEAIPITRIKSHETNGQQNLFEPPEIRVSEELQRNPFDAPGHRLGSADEDDSEWANVRAEPPVAPINIPIRRASTRIAGYAPSLRSSTSRRRRRPHSHVLRPIHHRPTHTPLPPPVLGPLAAGPRGYVRSPLAARPAGYESLRDDYDVQYTQRISLRAFLATPSILYDEDTLPGRALRRVFLRVVREEVAVHGNGGGRENGFGEGEGEGQDREGKPGWKKTKKLFGRVKGWFGRRR